MTPRRKPAVTRTTHTLNFAALGAGDFERMCVWLLQEEHFEDVEHLGAAGGEQGRDIVASRHGKPWAFQCKNVRQFGPKIAAAEIDKLLALDSSERPAVYVFLVTCPVSVKTRRAARKALGPNIKCAFLDLTELDRRIKQHPRVVREFFDMSAAGNESQTQPASASLAPGTRRVVRIHVSSPQDVAAERAVLDEVVSSINRTEGDAHGVHLEVYDWRRDAVPQIGPGNDEVLRGQSGRCDIYLGIMSATLGDGRTKAEFEEALAKYRDVGELHSRPIPPSTCETSRTRALGSTSFVYLRRRIRRSQWW